MTRTAIAALMVFAGAATAQLTVDFSSDGGGNALVNGQALTGAEFSPLFTLSSSGPNAGLAIFDTSDPGANDTSGDQDLLVNLGNALVLQNNNDSDTTAGVFDVPNDDPQGGTITFDFTLPQSVIALTLIDIDSGNSAVVTLTDSAGLTSVYDVPSGFSNDIEADGPAGFAVLSFFAFAPQFGEGTDPVVVTTDAGFNSFAVASLSVELQGSGGIDNLVFDGLVPAPAGAVALAGAGLIAVRRRR